MNIIFEAIIITDFIFMAFRFVMIVISKVIEKKCEKIPESKKGYKLLKAFLRLLIAATMWLIIVNNLVKMEGAMSVIQFYLTMVILGVSSVIWCYFSWDDDIVWIKPRWSEENELKSKKVVMYILLFSFAFLLGYHQSMSVFCGGYQIPPLYVATNNSIIVAIIALDRIMNQLVPKKDTETN